MPVSAAQEGAPDYDLSRVLPPIVLRPVKAATKEIKIGCILPLGPASAPEDNSVATAVLLAMKMAVNDELPRELPEYYVNITCYNTDCSGLAAAAGVLYAADQGAAAIIGDVCSTSSLAAAAAAKMKRIPVISPAATSPSLSMKDYFYRTVPSDIFQAFAASNLMYKDFGANRVGIVFESNSYGLGLADNLAAEDATSAKLVYEFRPGKGNATAAVAAAIAARDNFSQPIDALFLAMNDVAFAAEFLKEAAKKKLDIPLYGGDTLTSRELFLLLQDNPAAISNLTLVSVNPGDANFIEAFQRAAKAENNTKFEPYAAPAYDAMLALLKAVENAGKFYSDRVRLHDELQEVVFDGASGPVQFDMFGDVVSHAESYVYGKFDPNTGRPQLLGFIS